MPDKFTKPYNPADTESRIYAAWEESGLFNPDECVKQGVTETDAEIFSIVLPPPNVTGILHMGSALMLVIEDIMVRHARMQGKKTLWLPGTDSAAIATQARVEKNIQKEEGKSRHNLGREELLKRIEIFIEENRHTIVKQMRAMGSSLDWSRQAYTLDDARNKAVATAFKRMYDAGLIYRGNRIVNWDPKGQTTISDDEIVYEERAAKLYTFRYSKDFPIPIATTRPETKVGDVAVAVHPDDARYKEFVGKEYDAVFCDVPIHIKVVADKEVDPAFGTGAVGVTPAHSHVDWDIAARHLLSQEVIVINEYAKMTVPGRLLGKKTTEARQMVVEWLTSEGLLEKEEDITQNISTAERTGGVVEPLPKLQWWVEVDRPFVIPHSEIPGIASGSETTLKEIMHKAVESGATHFVTDHFEKTYSNWVNNLRDWCISRQIWFGHRIPVWYDESGEQIHIGMEAPTSVVWTQDPDVLDTWFSASLWTFSTLGWPEETEDLKRFHPTTVIETGYDIIPLWVSRMILMSGFHLGQVPFKTIYIHGLVRDGQGRKISKSLGNNIDPMDMGAKYGTDAVRVALVAGMAPGTDSRISEEKIKAYKLFANKLWNITRFILENTKDAAGGPERLIFPVGTPTEKNGSALVVRELFSVRDRELLEQLDTISTDVAKDMDEFRYHLAIEKLYHYTWHELADKILEESKPILAESDSAAKLSRQALLITLLDRVLKLLHPFMPFVTEEIYQSMPTKDTEFLMVAKWPAKSTVE